jgi:hypothetical protein
MRRPYEHSRRSGPCRVIFHDSQFDPPEPRTFEERLLTIVERQRVKEECKHIDSDYPRGGFPVGGRHARR